MVDPCKALDILHNASGHIRERWHANLDRDSAQANLDARGILFNCANQILREEVEGALILERSLNG